MKPTFRWQSRYATATQDRPVDVATAREMRRGGGCAAICAPGYVPGALGGGIVTRVARSGLILLLACTLLGLSATFGHAGKAFAAHTAILTPVQTMLPRGQLRAAPSGRGVPAGARAQSGTRARWVRPAGTPPTIDAQFAGLTYDGSAKPDANAAVGPNDIVEMVNAEWGAFSHTGTQLFFSTLRSWYGFASTIGIFDVRVVYDPQTGHYFMINIHYDPAGTGIGYIDLSASTTSSATGTWCQYHMLVQDGNNQPDFPGLGFDGRAVYVTMNMYPTNSNAFQYAKLLVLNEAQLSQCVSSVSMSIFSHMKNVNGSLAASIQPAQTQDSEPSEYLANVNNGSAGTFVTVWTLSNPLTTPTLSAAAVTVHKYFPPPPAFQGGTSDKVYTGGQALLDVAVRGGNLWTSHATAITIQSVNLAASQWFELDPVHNVVVQQQIRFNSGQYMYMSAIAVTSDGSAFMVYDQSNSATFISVKVSSRRSTDTLNTLAWTTQVQAGLGPYQHNSGSAPQPWGDFSSATVDPTDATKAWVCSEYASTSNQWATVIAEIGF